MSQQIELNIGTDLPFVRVNGTLVGGAIGLVLFCCRGYRHCSLSKKGKAQFSFGLTAKPRTWEALI